MRAASSAISTLSGWASKVRSIEMPPVDMLPVSASLTISPSGARRRASSPARQELLGAASTLILVSTFSWPTPRRGSALVISTSSEHGVAAVADDVGRHPLGDRLHLAADDEAAVVAAGDEGLDDDVAAARLALGDVEGLLDLLVAREVEAHAATVVAVERLDDDREADPAGRLDGAAQPCAPTPAWARAAPPSASSFVVRSLSLAMSTARAPVLEVIVARMRWAWTPWPSCTSEAELSRMKGMSRLTRLLEDGRRRRAEGDALGLAQEGVELRREVEAVLGLDEVVEQPDRELAGGDADRLVGVAVDDVVAAAHALDRAGLAAARSCPARVWSWSATCSATWPSQVPSCSRSTKPPGAPREQVWLCSPGTARAAAR